MPALFDVAKQLAFYASYHRNPINVAIHICCVPLILWTSLVITTPIHLIPNLYIPLSKYLAFEVTFASAGAIIFQLYYFVLEPVGALLYLPQMTFILLSATAFTHNNPDAMQIALGLFVFSWIAQFVGHGFAEGRSPALLENLTGALVLAPFFVHLELLFLLGFKPELHKQINDLAAVELNRVRQLEGGKSRQALPAST